MKIALRLDAFARIARRRGLPVHRMDEGYLLHGLLRELWQASAPSPFDLRGSGRCGDVWGYSNASAEQLRSHALDFGDPAQLDMLDGGVEGIASRPVPRLMPGRLVGFRLRVCPVVRLSGGRGGKRGREVDAFLARCWAGDRDTPVSREDVYRDWIAARLDGEGSGARLERVTLESFQRERFVRRSKPGADGERRAHWIERPDVRVRGELTVVDGARFAETLRRGVGRHRAFGFGMMLLIPPESAAAGASLGTESSRWS
ncbi:MAG: type I-E CRISPR-associated protein Cas6/Cse3/CasE [Planctomycetes bacterium]|nr:type I-E CRISPR-associated protein Cas6/Cse3/CasE [Planctomycetota bacterium]